MKIHGLKRPWLASFYFILLIYPVIAWSEPANLDEPASQEEMEKRLTVYDQQIAAKKNDAKLYLKRAEAYFKLRQFDKAVDDFTTALKLNDRLDEAYFGRGMALGRLGNIDEGIADLNTYIERHPKSSLAHTKRGIRYLWKGDRENAEKDLRQALTLNPRNAEAHDDLGVIHAQRGDYDIAAAHFLDTIKYDPSYQKGYHNLAMVYYLTNRNRQALKAVDAALKLLPEARDSVLLKAAILESLGQAQQAKTLRDEAEFLPQTNGSERAPVD